MEKITTDISSGGGLVTRLVLKRGWKLDRKVRGKERKKLEEQLAQVLPDVRVAYEASGRRTSSAVKEMLESDADLREKLKGVPVEWVDKACNEGKNEYRFRELRRTTWCSDEDRKDLYAADRFRRKWLGGRPGGCVSRIAKLVVIITVVCLTFWALKAFFR